jgi:hypothetical protein
MAVTTGTITGVHGITMPGGPALNSSGVPVFGAFLTFTISGTYSQSDQSQLTGVPTAMQGFLHNGKTITLLQACFASPGDEAGTPIGVGQVTVSGANMTFELTGGDLATQHTAALLGTVGLPIQVYVTYTEA